MAKDPSFATIYRLFMFLRLFPVRFLERFQFLEVFSRAARISLRVFSVRRRHRRRC